MSDATPQQEPSMEEILASIRRIISEDEQPAEETEAQSEEVEATEESEAETSDDVLELTEVAEEEEAEEEPAAEASEPEPEPEPEEVSEESEELSIDDVLDEVDVPDDLELRDEAEPAPEESVAPVAALEQGLIADQTASAAEGMLSGLVAAVDRAHGGSTLGDGNRTIEDLVKEVMRPMVKEWLDENLPGLTERLVRREIERLARRAEGD